MSKVIREEVTRKRSVVVKYVAKPALVLEECEACGKTFRMDEFCNDKDLAELHGTFDRCAAGQGNTFRATACSFKCAHEMFAKEGWKKIKRYEPYVQAGANLARAELRITSYVANGKDLAAAWDKAPEGQPPR